MYPTEVIIQSSNGYVVLQRTPDRIECKTPDDRVLQMSQRVLQMVRLVFANPEEYRAKINRDTIEFLPTDLETCAPTSPRSPLLSPKND